MSRIVGTTPAVAAGAGGRKAVGREAPDGYGIRMMEPEEAGALLAIERAGTQFLIEAGRSELADERAPTVEEFRRFVTAHEVVVAEEKSSGAAVGYAAARDDIDLYWLAEMVVDPVHGGRGIGAALLASVIERARWFFYRAVGLSTYVDVPFNAPFYERHGFVSVADDDLDAALAARLAAECPAGAALANRTVMVRWL